MLDRPGARVGVERIERRSRRRGGCHGSARSGGCRLHRDAEPEGPETLGASSDVEVNSEFKALGALAVRCGGRTRDRRVRRGGLRRFHHGAIAAVGAA